MKLIRNKDGLTMVELLVVLSLIAIVAGSIPLVLRTGGSSWRTRDDHVEVTQNALIGMDKLVNDLKQSLGVIEISDPSDTHGYISFRDSNNVIKSFRYSDGYLEYGEPDELETLAGPVDSLRLIGYDINGSQTMVASEIRSVRIELGTQKSGISVPVSAKVFIAKDTAGQGSGSGSSSGSGGDGGSGGDDCSGGSSGGDGSGGGPGDGDYGTGLTKFGIFGKEGVSISNSTTIVGSVGTHGSLMLSVNSVSITGNLVTSGAFRGSNNSKLNGNLYTRGNIDLANSFEINGDVYTNGNVKMSNSSRINGNISHPSGTTITTYNSARYNSQSEGGAPYTMFLTTLPPAESFTPGSEDINLHGSQTRNLAPGHYGDLNLSNSSRAYLSSGTYYFNSITLSNTSSLNIDLSGGPISIYVKNKVQLSNSSAFNYLNAGAAGGADKVYLEVTYSGSGYGFICSNSVNWKGTIYAPNSGISFSNGTTAIGALYSGKTISLNNSFTFTHVPAINLPSKFTSPIS